MRPIELRSVTKIFFIALFVILVTTTSAQAAQEKVLHNFVDLPHGAYPQANVIADTAGNLYGTTPEGGKFGHGTVFELTPGKNNKWSQTVLYSFTGGNDGANPVAGLVFDNAGDLYGTTATGGIMGQRCYYSYGCGVVFELSPGAHGTWTESVLHSFAGYASDGGTPVASLIFDAAGNLYGTTEGGGSYGWGTVFELTPGSKGTWTETILYNFTGNTDGGSPLANLTFDTLGNLYGTTEYGGDVNCNPQENNTTCGTVFELINNGKGSWTETVLCTFIFANGAYPLGNLVFDAAGNMYGTTLEGPGFAGSGIVFRLAPNLDGGWTQTILWIFEGGPDGSYPTSGVILGSSGQLYGTTQYGGGSDSCSEGCGTVFELTPRSKGNWIEKVIHRFHLPAHGRNDGTQPLSGLLFDPAGNLYGTAEIGGDQSCDNDSVGCGTVFELSPASDGKWTPSLLYAFSYNPQGASPPAGVISDGAGNLYGTTGIGGAGNFGVAFELTPQPGGSWKEIVLHAFVGGRDGAHPSTSLISDTAGNLYGTTVNGGTQSCNDYYSCGGTVFELTPIVHRWKETVLYRFGKNYGRGQFATGGLVLDSTGNLYGTTVEGGSTNCGSYGCGTVYKLTPVGGGKWKKDVLYRFQGGSDAFAPYCTLIFDDKGALYGTTWAGGLYGNGTIFKLSLGSDGKWNESVLYSFKGLSNGDGSSPFAGVIFDRDGNLYGTTYWGGDKNCSNYGCGVVFELSPVGTSAWKETVLHRFRGDLDGANPASSLTIDADGNVYGATPDDSTDYEGGAVFKLSRGSNGTWTMDVLHDFKYGSQKGFCPVGPLIFDATGNIYGAASCGGTDGSGTIFELSATSDGNWIYNPLTAPQVSVGSKRPSFVPSSARDRRVIHDFPLSGVRYER